MVRIVQTFQPRNRTPKSGMAFATTSATTAPTDEPTRYQAIRRSTPRMLAGPADPGLLGQLDRTDRHGPGFAGAIDPKIDRPADEVAAEPTLEVADAFDRVAVELDDDVADMESGRGRRAGLEQLHDLEAALAADPVGDRFRERPRPADDAEERASDASVDDEGLDDGSRRRVDRHGKPETDARDRGVDAHDATS